MNNNKSQRPLAPSNLRGGANLQWGKGLGLANGANLTNFCVMKVKFRKF